MSDTTPNPELERLTAFVGTVRTALGLAEGADTDAINTALTSRLGDAAAAVERAKTIEQTWANEKVDAALRSALTAAGILPDFMEDAMLRAKAVGFVLNDKGEVVTKPDAKDTIPNTSPAAWVQGELKAKAPRFWPTSIGAGAKGGGFTAHSGPDLSCFKGGTMTDQMSMVARVGERAVLDSLKRAGITPPPWLKGGGR
ncbi:MAG: hypothetical protein GIKADHBN_00445 [Phycisphaerales bacterium]|nr:hypothetical protein [Phycisphaerales bacterium]